MDIKAGCVPARCSSHHLARLLSRNFITTSYRTSLGGVRAQGHRSNLMEISVFLRFAAAVGDQTAQPVKEGTARRGLQPLIAEYGVLTWRTSPYARHVFRQAVTFHAINRPFTPGVGIACNAPTCGYPDWRFTDFIATAIWRTSCYRKKSQRSGMHPINVSCRTALGLEFPAANAVLVNARMHHVY
jgi:hypothetical protein